MCAQNRSFEGNDFACTGPRSKEGSLCPQVTILKTLHIACIAVAIQSLNTIDFTFIGLKIFLFLAKLSIIIIKHTRGLIGILMVVTVNETCNLQ